MINISVFVRNEEQLKIALKYPIQDIYTDNYDLVKKYPELYYQVPRVPNDKPLPKHLLVGDVGVIWEKKEECILVADYFLNIANHATIETLLQNKVKKIALSVEATLSVVEDLLKINSYPIEILIYGRVENMMLKRHPLIDQTGYRLKDYQNDFYPISVDEEKHVHIFDSQPLNKIDDIKDYINVGVISFRLDFFDEKEAEINIILNQATAICQKFTK